VTWRQIYRTVRVTVYKKVSIIIVNMSTSTKQETPHERCRGIARAFHVKSTTLGACFSSYTTDKLSGGTDVVSIINLPE